MRDMNEYRLKILISMLKRTGKYNALPFMCMVARGIKARFNIIKIIRGRGRENTCINLI